MLTSQVPSCSMYLSMFKNCDKNEKTRRLDYLEDVGCWTLGDRYKYVWENRLADIVENINRKVIVTWLCAVSCLYYCSDSFSDSLWRAEKCSLPGRDNAFHLDLSMFASLQRSRPRVDFRAANVCVHRQCWSQVLDVRLHREIKHVQWAVLI